MRFKYKIVALFYFLIALLPSVYAQPFNFRGSFANSIENFFRIFFRDFLGRDYIMLGITFIAFFLIVYSIFLAASKRIKIFQGEKGVNNQGIAFSIGFSLLSTFGIFYNYRSNIFETVIRIYEVASILALVLIGLVVYFLVYYGTRQGDKGNTCLALLAAGLAFYLMAWIIDSSQYKWIGFIIIIIGIICLVFRLFGFKGLGSSGGGSGGGSRGGSGGGRSNPREKYGDVEVTVFDGLGNRLDGALVEIRNRRMMWRNKGITSGGNSVRFRYKKGFWSLRAIHNGVEGRVRIRILPGITNPVNIILGAGPGGSGTLSGTVNDGTNNLSGVSVHWNGLSTRSRTDGTYIIPVQNTKFGSYNVTADAGSTFSPYTSPSLVIVDLSNINQRHDINMVSVSPINVKVEFDYGGGFTSLLIPNQTGVTVKITSIGPPNPPLNFTNPNLSILEIQRSTGANTIYTGNLLVSYGPQEYNISNVDTTNCIGVRYIFV